MIYLHMPACQKPAGLYPQRLALGRQQGRMQQGRSQPGISRRRSKTAAGGPVPLGPPELFCFAAGWWLAGCVPAACGPAAFLRQGTADAALLDVGMQGMCMYETSGPSSRVVRNVNIHMKKKQVSEMLIVK